jgi:hypothetical protein
MGLAVETGMLADLFANDPEGAEWTRESLARVNDVLAENNLPQHNEPEHLPKMHNRAGTLSYPYSFLHHLRRVFARVTNDPDWMPKPTPDGDDPAEDPVLDEEMCLMSSHLLCHSDAEGFYLPIDFNDVIIDDKDQDRIPGVLLGSSYRLFEELVQIAPKLGIALDDGQLFDAEADKINKDAESEKGLWIEKTVWISLFEAARLSIEHKTAVCFA